MKSRTMSDNHELGSTFDPNSLTFSLSRGYRASIYAQIPLFFVLAVGAIYVGIVDRASPNPNAPYVVLIAALFAACGIYSLSIIPRLRDRITVTQTRITQSTTDGSEISIMWKEIATIRVRHFLNRVDIVSTEPRRAIRIEYQVQGFTSLMDIVDYYVLASRNNKALEPHDVN